MIPMRPKPNAQCFAFQQLTLKYDVTDDVIDEPLGRLYGHSNFTI